MSAPDHKHRNRRIRDKALALFADAFDALLKRNGWGSLHLNVHVEENGAAKPVITINGENIRVEE